jgi:DNA primase
LFSAIAAGPNAIAILGKDLRASHAEQIITSGFSDIVVLLDADAPQRAAANGVVDPSVRAEQSVRVAMLPWGDPAEVPKQVLSEAIRGAKPLGFKARSMGRCLQRSKGDPL